MGTDIITIFNLYKKTPQNIEKPFLELLDGSVTNRLHSDYVKWLKYYLDFCDKYKLDHYIHDNLHKFKNKLKHKNQTEEQIKQAHKAVSIYFESNSILSDKSLKPNIQSWKTVFRKLESEVKLRHYSPRTLNAYSYWVRKFSHFMSKKDPAEVASQDVKGFLEHLAVKVKVSASTQNQAFNSLLFLFRNVLNKELGGLKDTIRPKRRRYIPVVLSRKEINKILKHLEYPYELLIKLLYGCGLRLNEAITLRVHNFNFDSKILTIRGKGEKSRTIPLPESILPHLHKHLQRVKNLHENDLKTNYDGVFLPDALDKKYRNAAKEFAWQWFFPAKKLSYVLHEKKQKRYHLHDSIVHKVIKLAVRKTTITKRVSAHTFRHSYETHLLEAGYDIRIIQELLGHSDVRTTMIYTHTMKSLPAKQVRSPLDF